MTIPARFSRHPALLVLWASLAAASGCDYVKQTVDRVRPTEKPAPSNTPAPKAPPPSTPGARGARSSSGVAADVRARAAECTAQANTLTSKPPLRSDQTLLGRESHYSEAYGRCFMKVNHVNPEAKQSPELLPSTYYELWDVAAERIVSVCTDARVSGTGAFCSVEGLSFVGCDVCQALVRDRMSK